MRMLPLGSTSSVLSSAQVLRFGFDDSHVNQGKQGARWLLAMEVTVIKLVIRVIMTTTIITTKNNVNDFRLLLSSVNLLFSNVGNGRKNQEKTRHSTPRQTSCWGL